MKPMLRKRLIRASILLVAVCVCLFFFRLAEIALRPTAIYSGVLLFVLVVFLAAFNLRKRIRFLPLGSAESWLQWHIYVALFTGVLFGVHIRWHWPTGMFDWLLAGSYLITFFSGVIGLFMSRAFARRLTTRGNEVLFQHIPARLHTLQNEVESIVMNCMEQTESTAIPIFYVGRLKPFFARPRNQIQHLLQSNRPRFALLGEIRGYERYLDETERQALEQIAERVTQKDGLDFQHSLQSALKIWLFVHIPMTYALLVFATIHLLLVFAFSGVDA
jgi:hypothetical protein